MNIRIEPPEHGTRARYNSHKFPCHCDPCSNANAAYIARRRQHRSTNTEPDGAKVAPTPQPTRLFDATPEWHDRAACKGMDTDLFFPDDARTKEQTAVALAVCAKCEVRAECLEWALDTRPSDGIYGGLTESQLKRKRETPR